jgi:nicotinamide-nucleotide amidase
MRIEVIAVGTELLLGQIVNTNAAELGRRFADAGLDHFHQSVVGDNLARVAAAIRLAVSRSDAVIITGGIGPTQDDLTREAICEAAGVPMRFSEQYADRLRRWWERRGREMPDSNLKQAEYPEGAEMIPNDKGTAPGLRVEVGGAWVFALPGVPEEMLPMVDRDVIPFLMAEAGGEEAVVISRLIRTWGESESRVADLLGDLFDAGENPTMAFLASSGEIKIRLTAKAAQDAAALALIAPVEAEVRRRLGHRVFGVDGDTIEKVVFRLLGERGWTLGTAESATGGMVAARLTSVPGASKAYRGSIVAYAPDLKEQLLGVDRSILEGDGVVSAATALAMAEGAARSMGVDVAVAVTGSAGPDELEQPAGTMIVAVRTPEEARARVMRMPGDRERVRTYTTTAALQLLRLGLEGAWWGPGGDAWGRG